jgi:hypothetical protein
LHRNPSTIDRSLSWADATFYGACSSFVAFFALINTLSHAEKWVGPNVLDRVPLMAALHHSGYRIPYYVTTSFLVNAPFYVLSALVGALVFLIAQRPRSLGYSTLIMAPQILLFVAAALDGHRLTWLWVTTGLAWVIMGIGVFHSLSLAASHVAVVTLGREKQPRARGGSSGVWGSISSCTTSIGRPGSNIDDDGIRLGAVGPGSVPCATSPASKWSGWN